MKYLKHLSTVCAAIFCIAAAYAQVGPPPPPPVLGAPPVPPENPITPAKTSLGKALFWDEQLSSNRTMACGTCHIPARGGSDQRSVLGARRATHPGVDLIFGNDDDVTGSPGVPQSNASGAYVPEPSFSIREQVTRRKSIPVLNAGFPRRLFWDGRAGETLRDPVSGVELIPRMAALETQVLAPPVNSVEMAHLGRDWPQVAAQIAAAPPLMLSPEVPGELATWIAGRSYPELFNEAFGTPEVTPARIAMAIATYERTLVSNQAPVDFDTQASPALTPEEALGRDVFRRSQCAACHAGPRLTDDQFHYTGVRPQADDLGRFEVTGEDDDRGAMKTPGLRNIELHAPYMHNGRFNTLEEVVDFYNRGGDFNAPNKDRRVRPLNLTQEERAALVAFMKRPLTDPRVAGELPPFDRPLLYSESNRRPQIIGPGTPGTNALQPKVVALEPPFAGNTAFTVGVFDALPGAVATLVIDTTDPGPDADVPAAAFLTHEQSVISSAGAASLTLTLPATAEALDIDLFGRWFIADPAAPGGVAATAAFRFRIFGDAVEAPEGEGGAEGEGEGEGEAEGQGEVVEHPHSCDQDDDGRLGLSELLRSIQFYNSGEFHCAAGTEDGFAPGAGEDQSCTHDGDYNPRDWRIELSELLRLIQFYNAEGYRFCPSENTEDGYCPEI